MNGEQGEGTLERRVVWNVGVTVGTPAEIIEAVVQRIRQQDDGNSGRGLHVACANPHSQMQVVRNSTFHDALQHMDIVLPDGVGTVLAARLLGYTDIRRFTGPDFFAALSDTLNMLECSASYYFLGSTEPVLEGIRRRMGEWYPKIRVAGCLAPPFAPAEALVSEEILQDIREKRPTVLWVGMTAPKQELWMHYARDALSVPIVAAIGAEFDYFSGTKKRPPWLVRRLGFQWLHRLIQEPGRTWRRNFISTPLFVFNVLRYRWRLARRGTGSSE